MLLGRGLNKPVRRVGNFLAMFDILFGWSKASKWSATGHRIKALILVLITVDFYFYFFLLQSYVDASGCSKRLIKQVQCRLKLLKSKRHSIVKQLREDVAQLVKIGREDIAFTRAEHLCRDESTVETYKLLDNFCEYIIDQFPYIRRHKDCPNDINEAVSSLIYASARCGDLPELRSIRKLFGKRYGQRFEITALELLPGNLVNHQIKEKISIVSIPDDVKQRLVDEIAKDYCLRPEILALEYTSEQQQLQQGKELGGFQALDADSVQPYDDRFEKSRMESGNATDIESKAIYVDSASANISPATESHSLQDCDIISTSISSPIIQQSSPDMLKSPMQNISAKVEKFSGLESPCSLNVVTQGSKQSQTAHTTYSATPKFKDDRKTTASSSESLPVLADGMVVYLDDIEEVQSPVTKEGSCQDQRIFKFKSSVLSKGNKIEDSYDVNYRDPYESGNESTGSSRSRKRVKMTRKTSRKRPASQENSGFKDINCDFFYDKQGKRHPTRKHRSYLQSKGLRERTLGKSEQLSNPEMGQKKTYSGRHLKHEAEDCYMNNQCHLCTGDRRDEEVTYLKQKRGIKVIYGLQQRHSCNRFHHCHCSLIRASDEGMVYYILPQSQRRKSCEFAAVSYDHCSSPECQSDKQSNRNGKVKGFDSPGSCVASDYSCSKATRPWTRKEMKPPYLRAMTMPQQRSRDAHADSVVRSCSFPIQSPNHVHPKLPDYDDITAKFMALKKENMQNRTKKAPGRKMY